jgi:hypothetical protein
MPKYDYRCELNGLTVEVSHSMSCIISTWGELCELAGIDAGETPAESPVHKIISGGYVATGSTSPGLSSHATTTPTCCSGGMCSFNK